MTGASTWQDIMIEHHGTKWGGKEYVCGDVFALADLLAKSEMRIKKYTDVVLKIAFDFNEQQKEINKLKANVKELETVAESWMNDYQKLKDEYEPDVLIVSKVTGR